MDADLLANTVIPHLDGQFERAMPVLFTGSGFSLGARNIIGRKMPLAKDIKREIWSICFPGDEYDEGTSLQSLYEHAVLRHSRLLTEILANLLTVDLASVPSWYATVFSMPWSRCYTLNVDDLAEAVAGHYSFPRGLEVVSATTGAQHSVGTESASRLQLVHLNGMLSDLPANVTFSTTQYAERLARPEPWYVRFRQIF